MRYVSIFHSGALEPLTSKYRILLIDQRGTGQSGVLECPDLQKGPYSAVRAGACGERLGPDRAFYDTGSSVQDLENLRLELGQEKLAFFGVSYGTIVAQQYARTHPEQTAALVLDGVASPRGVDPFSLDKFGSVPRVLRELCAGDKCEGITNDPVDDLARLQQILDGRKFKGRAFNGDGRSRRATVSDEDLFYSIINGDFDPTLRASIPAAFAAARHGDPALLIRQMNEMSSPGSAIGPPATSYSQALFVSTMCADQDLPYSLSDPFDVNARGAATDTALAAIDPARYAPFTYVQVLLESPSLLCLHWPRQRVRSLSTEPLPDVPALLLMGRLDVRTPLESGDEVAVELPQADSVKVPGTGHAVAFQDTTGCVKRAVARWVKGKEAGDSCRARSNAFPLDPVPPGSLGRVAPPPGLSGRTGKVAQAAVLTAADALRFGTQRFARFWMRGGGLHGGYFTSSTSRRRSGLLAVDVKLKRYAYLPGLRVSGPVSGSAGGPRRAKLRVRGKGIDGRIRIEPDGKVTGLLNGKPLAFRMRKSGRRSGTILPRSARIDLRSMTR